MGHVHRIQINETRLLLAGQEPHPTIPVYIFDDALVGTYVGWVERVYSRDHLKLKYELSRLMFDNGIGGHFCMNLSVWKREGQSSCSTMVFTRKGLPRLPPLEAICLYRTSGEESEDVDGWFEDHMIEERRETISFDRGDTAIVWKQPGHVVVGRVYKKLFCTGGEQVHRKEAEKIVDAQLLLCRSRCDLEEGVFYVMYGDRRRRMLDVELDGNSLLGRLGSITLYCPFDYILQPEIDVF